MWIIVGLGNPGAAYARTRHNVGFMVVECLARRWRIALRDDGAALRLGRGTVAGQASALVQPHTYMNRSGEALEPLPHDPNDRVVVVYDDLDLPSGQLRVRPRGGSGGHRGVASIVEHRGGDFARVRIGIGRPAAGADAADHVLAPLSDAELKDLRGTVERAADAVECVLTDGVEVAMNRFNTRPASAAN